MTFLKKKHLMLALVIVLSVPAPSPANANADIFGAMFRMMLVMMNTMSDAMLGNSNDLGWGSTSPLGMTTLPMMSGMYGMNPMTGFGGMSPWSGMSGMNSIPMNGMSPWSTPFNSWSNPFTNAYPSYANNPYGHQQYGGNYPAPQGSFLDGRWYGNSGDVLEVRGNRFRLQDGQSSINGMIRIDNNIVSLYSPQTGSVTQYSFIRNQSELILQDATGRVLRFWLRPINSASYRF
jgi:hypothetical protein